MSPADSTPPTGCVCYDACELLTIKELSALLKLHPGTLWRMTAQAEAGLPCNGFPKPLRLAVKSVRWRAVDVKRYLAALAGDGQVQGGGR